MHVLAMLLFLGLAVPGLAGCVSLEADGGEGSPGPSDGASGSGAGGSSSGINTSSSSTPSCDERCSCPYLDGCGIPAHDAGADVRFVLNASYAAGESVRWVVHNDGSDDYSAMMPTACSIEVYTQAGRRVPMGSCSTDVVAAVRISAGNDTQLGSWNGGECVRSEDQWYAGRCVEWSPLPPGTYEVRRTFCRYAENWREDCSATSRSGAQVVLT